MLGDCLYCDEPLTTEATSVACDSCDDGFHVVCAREADALQVEERSGLLRSTSYRITCPACGETWDVSFDPRE